METSVKLIAATKPNIPGLNTLEDYIAYVARVSNPTNQMNNLTGPKLLKYLLNHRHFSPFEMASITLEINTTRDIARQILRHRSFSFQEFSQRYAEVDTMNFATREARLQDTKNRQNSLKTNDAEIHQKWNLIQEDVSKMVQQYYHEALAMGVAKEQARAILPEGLTPSTLYMAGTVRSWIHYIQVRTEQGVQEEHREIAFKALHAIKEEIPSIVDMIVQN